MKGDNERIDLFRGGSVVSTLVGAFGVSLKETRLTALLGYLIALKPEPFIELFGFKGTPRVVTLENHGETGRSDIHIETTVGKGVVEAKIGASDPIIQARKYGARWIALLSQHRPSVTQMKQKRVVYLDWQRVANLLVVLSRSQNAKVKFISRDIIKNLEEHRMVNQRNSVELYAREINEPATLAMFLKAQMYGCWYEEGSRLVEALYFAPHFGQAIARTHPGVRVGISYIARIEHVEVIETWKDLIKAVIDVRGKPWWNSHMNEIKKLRTHPQWDWKARKKRSFLFLGPPRLAFNPPVHKGELQKGHGWLSKKYLSFDDLFSGWGI